MTRRTLLGSILATGAVYAMGGLRSMAGAPNVITIERFSDAGKSLGVAKLPSVVKKKRIPESSVAAHTEIAAALSYIGKRKHKMRYASFYENNLPIGLSFG